LDAALEDGQLLLVALRRQILREAASRERLFGFRLELGGGLRKMRWALAGRGKSGGARVIYYWFVAQAVVYLLLIYAKNEQEDLSPEQLKLLRKTVEAEFK